MDSSKKTPLIFGASGAAFAALLALSWWPNAGCGFLAWTAFAPFGFAALRAATVKNAFLFGVYAGFLFYAITLYWIYPTCRAGDVAAPVSLAAWLALALVLSLEWGLLALALKRLAVYGGFFPPLAAAALAALEYGKVSLCVHGVWFPWFLTGYTQWKYPAVIQIASVCGVYGVSFAVAFTGFALGYAVHLFRPGDYPRRRKAAVVAAAAPLALLAGLVFYGHARLGSAADSGPAVKIAVIQPNIDQYKKWNEDFVAEILAKIASLSGKIAAENPGTAAIVWPESALPGSIDDLRYARYVKAVAKQTGAWQIAGTVTSRGDKNYVSACAVSPSGAAGGVYDKRKLVPFGEFVPLRGFLGHFVSAVNKLGEFSPGERSQPPLAAGGLKFGMGICYETIFPWLWRGYPAAGANLLVNITNDGWYLDSAAPWQHFSAAVFRAVETGLPLVRAANTGISGWIDGFGRVRARTALNTEAALVFDVPITPVRAVYSGAGDVFALLMCCAAALALACAGRMR
ncbi:MAG: apolipoprotein N-acyltransferase [Elusimicrobiales bacterium]|nr:apolipoprotein N-acyltransferase [Elusimicrobiales bacterium]